MINFIRKLMRKRIVLWTHINVETGKVKKRVLLVDKYSEIYLYTQVINHAKKEGK